MWPIGEATTAQQKLAEVIQRLAASPLVEGIVLGGSTASEDPHPNSDHDLAVVVAELPVGVIGVATVIERRLADVFCWT